MNTEFHVYSRIFLILTSDEITNNDFPIELITYMYFLL